MNCAEDAAHAAAPALLRILVSALSCHCQDVASASDTVCHLPSLPFPHIPILLPLLWLCLLPALLHAGLLPAACCLLSPVTARWGNWSAALLCSVPIFHIYTQYTLLFLLDAFTQPAPISIMPGNLGLYITIYKYGNAHRSVIRSHLNDCQTTRPE